MCAYKCGKRPLNARYGSLQPSSIWMIGLDSFEHVTCCVVRNNRPKPLCITLQHAQHLYNTHCYINSMRSRIMQRTIFQWPYRVRITTAASINGRKAYRRSSEHHLCLVYSYFRCDSQELAIARIGRYLFWFFWFSKHFEIRERFKSYSALNATSHISW